MVICGKKADLERPPLAHRSLAKYANEQTPNWQSRPRRLLFSCLSVHLFEAHSGTAAVLFNERNSRSLKRKLYDLNCVFGNLTSTFFKIDNRRKPQAGILCEGCLIHLQQSSGSSRLCGS